MRKSKIFLIIIFISTLHVYSQDKNMDVNICQQIYSQPVLYANNICDSNIIEYWTNYWYSNSDINSIVSDSIYVQFEFKKLPNNCKLNFDRKKYRFVALLSLKCGDYDNSYNVINPIIFDTIELVNVELKISKLIKTNLTQEVFYTIDSDVIYIEDILNNIPVQLFTNQEGIELKRYYYLNQLVIKGLFIDSRGDVVAKQEFVFFVNGKFPEHVGEGGIWPF